jgi:FkbM family methyltransferase
MNQRDLRYYENLLNEYYQKYLKRNPDKQGFSHYLSLLEKGVLNKDTLRERIINSDEYKIVQLTLDFLQQSKVQIQIHGKSFFVNTSNNTAFWAQLQLGLWEPNTFKIFDTFLDPEHSYIDIGSWIGPTVLYGCQKAKYCYAFEPDPVAFGFLNNNVDLNDSLKDKIHLSDNCIMDFSGLSYLTPKTESGGDSLSSTIFKKSLNSWEISSITIDDFILKYSVDNCNFLKIDIEGGEFKILPSMLDFFKQQKPTLYLSLHPFLMENPKESLENIFHIIDTYDYLYDNKLNEKRKNWILNEENFNRSFEIVLTDKQLN